MVNFWSKHRIYFELVLYFVIFFMVTYFVKIQLNEGWRSDILGMTGFIFGVIYAFSVSNRKTRMEEVRETLRSSDAHLLKIYKYAQADSKETADRMRTMIDNLLMAQIDYKLVDIEYTTPQLLKMWEEAAKIKDVDTRKVILCEIDGLIDIQKSLIHKVNDRITSLEWIVLFLLGGIILTILNTMTNDTMLSVIIVSLLSSCFVLFFVIMRELDNLAWQEKEWIWNPLIQLFTELDLLPYFPGDLVKARKISISSLENIDTYRFAIYKHPYPDNTDKEIKVKHL